MQKFLEILQRNRFAVLGALVALVIGGCALVRGLPVESVPDISPRQVLVSAIAPGLATQEVERFITFPIESAMTGIPGLKDLRSVSRSGVSVVYVQFDDNTDINLDRARVNERIETARANIVVPGLVLNMGPLTTGMGEIMQFEIRGEGYSLMDLNRIMTWKVAPQLKLLSGVVDVNISGGAEQTYQVVLDDTRLNGYGISVGDVFAAVDANNAASGGGWIEHHAEQQIVVGRGLIGGLDDFGSIPLRLGAGGRTIRLRDVGEVSWGARTRLGAVTRDGLGETVIGVVMMQVGASSDATLAGIRAALPGIVKTLPKGISLKPYYERSTLTDETIATVRENLAMGAVLVIAVLVMVIGDLRASLVIASAIPVALIAAMSGMRLFGISANLLSLGAIDFGMIVDSSLVVIENVMSRRAESSEISFFSLVVLATRQVARPVAFAILVIVMVYLPILTLDGIEGKMFRPMAQTVIMALLASLAYCVVCIPVIAVIVLKRGTRHDDTWLVSWLRRVYSPVLMWGERRAPLVFAMTLGIFLFSCLLAARLGGEFLPQLQEGALTLTSTRLPSASLTTVLHSLTREEQILRRFPEVATVVTSSGTAAIPTDPMGVNESDSFIFLKPRSEWKTAHTQEGLVDAMDRALREQMPDALYSWSQPVQMRMDDLLSGVRTQIAVSIYGDDLQTLSAVGDQVAAAINSVPGAADVAPQGGGTVTFLHIDVDREKAARLGVSVSEILNVVEAVGGHIGRPVIANDALINTQIRFATADAASASRIAQLRVRRTDGSGSVMLGEVTHISTEDAPPRISRDRIRRRMVVQANVRGRDLSSFVAAAQKAVAAQVSLPHGYRLYWDGQFRNLQSAMARLEIVVPISMALIFALLVLALGSIMPAVLVFINLPIAATGGVLALTLRGLPFSISAGIGFIALFGVAILNGVVLMSAIQARRSQGMDAMRAAFAAAEDRFRPVIATALVASLGFFPMAFSGSAGAEVERPLATVVIGGLVSSTFLTLLVLPSLYARVMRRHN